MVSTTPGHFFKTFCDFADLAHLVAHLDCNARQLKRAHEGSLTQMHLVMRDREA